MRFESLSCRNLSGKDDKCDFNISTQFFIQKNLLN